MNQTTLTASGSKYRQLYQWIVDRILDGTYPYHQKLPSESSLCEQFGISRQTVRNAFHDLEADGYITRAKGSGSFVNKQVRSKEKIIGVLFPTLSNHITSKILTGLESVFTSNGYSMLLEQSHNRTEAEALFLKKMLTSKVSGLIIEGAKAAFPSPNEDLYAQLRELNIPYVFVNNHFTNVPGPSVMWDDEKASYIVTTKLIESGHTDIAGLFRFDEMQGLYRYLGYVKALMDHSLPVQEDLISWYGLSEQPREEKRQYQYINLFIDDILESCSALICYNDSIVCHVVPYLTGTKNVSIPKDLTVVSFDNSDISRLYDSHRIPSVSHPKEKLGQLAANVLMEYIQNPSKDPAQASNIMYPVSAEEELTFRATF